MFWLCKTKCGVSDGMVPRLLPNCDLHVITCSSTWIQVSKSWRRLENLRCLGCLGARHLRPFGILRAPRCGWSTKWHFLKIITILPWPKSESSVSLFKELWLINHIQVFQHQLQHHRLLHQQRRCFLSSAAASSLHQQRRCFISSSCLYCDNDQPALSLKFYWYYSCSSKWWQ